VALDGEVPGSGGAQLATPERRAILDQQMTKNLVSGLIESSDGLVSAGLLLSDAVLQFQDQSELVLDFIARVFEFGQDRVNSSGKFGRNFGFLGGVTGCIPGFVELLQVSGAFLELFGAAPESSAPPGEFVVDLVPGGFEPREQVERGAVRKDARIFFGASGDFFGDV
jgi:hypothetical protein